MLAYVLPHFLGTYLSPSKDASAVFTVEIMYGEIEDVIKEPLNILGISDALGYDFFSEKLPVSENPSLEQDPEGGNDIEVTPMS